MTIDRRLLPLKCGRCSADLQGEDGSRIFFCRECDRAWDFSGAEVTSHELVHVLPQKELPLTAAYFPFWHIQGDYSVSRSNLRQTRTGKAWFFVPAFFIKRINFFGDIGLFYTRNRLTPVPGQKCSYPIATASRPLEIALAYPAIYIQTELCQNEDIMELDVRISSQVRNMLLVPFFQDGDNGRLIDSQLGWHYPFNAIF